MNREMLYRGFFPDGRAAFTGLPMPSIMADYSREAIASMHIFEWTNVMDWRGINIYRGDLLQVYAKGEPRILGYVEYEPQLCRYIVHGEKSYCNLNESAMTGSEAGIKLDSVEIVGNSFTHPPHR